MKLKVLKEEILKAVRKRKKDKLQKDKGKAIEFTGNFTLVRLTWENNRIISYLVERK